MLGDERREKPDFVPGGGLVKRAISRARSPRSVVTQSYPPSASIAFMVDCANLPVPPGSEWT